jgi:hypothetical protein
MRRSKWCREHAVVRGLARVLLLKGKGPERTGKKRGSAAADRCPCFRALFRRRNSSRRVPPLTPADAGPRARRVAAPPRRGVRAHYGGAAPPAAGRRPVPREGLDPVSFPPSPLSSVRPCAVAWLSAVVLAQAEVPVCLL